MPNSTLASPSASLSITLPVKPSVTITSVVPRRRSRPSTLPWNRMPRVAASSTCASRVSSFPFSGSSPIDMSPTVGASVPYMARA
jgi:hypothetical protein